MTRTAGSPGERKKRNGEKKEKKGETKGRKEEKKGGLGGRVRGSGWCDWGKKKEREESK